MSTFQEWEKLWNTFVLAVDTRWLATEADTSEEDGASLRTPQPDQLLRQLLQKGAKVTQPVKVFLRQLDDAGTKGDDDLSLLQWLRTQWGHYYTHMTTCAWDVLAQAERDEPGHVKNVFDNLSFTHLFDSRPPPKGNQYWRLYGSQTEPRYGTDFDSLQAVVRLWQQRSAPTTGDRRVAWHPYRSSDRLQTTTASVSSDAACSCSRVTWNKVRGAWKDNSWMKTYLETDLDPLLHLFRFWMEVYKPVVETFVSQQRSEYSKMTQCYELVAWVPLPVAEEASRKLQGFIENSVPQIEKAPPESRQSVLDGLQRLCDGSLSQSRYQVLLAVYLKELRVYLHEASLLSLRTEVLAFLKGYKRGLVALKEKWTNIADRHGSASDWNKLNARALEAVEEDTERQKSLEANSNTRMSSLKRQQRELCDCLVEDDAKRALVVFLETARRQIGHVSKAPPPLHHCFATVKSFLEAEQVVLQQFRSSEMIEWKNIQQSPIRIEAESKDDPSHSLRELMTLYRNHLAVFTRTSNEAICSIDSDIIRLWTSYRHKVYSLEGDAACKGEVLVSNRFCDGESIQAILQRFRTALEKLVVLHEGRGDPLLSVGKASLPAAPGTWTEAKMSIEAATRQCEKILMISMQPFAVQLRALRQAWSWVALVDSVSPPPLQILSPSISVN